ncbi:MAG: hypothetical protein CVU57_25115, partial [Deltaproteobacteria bacterium HGW-Deltaproteobacteria-15]
DKLALSRTLCPQAKRARDALSFMNKATNMCCAQYLLIRAFPTHLVATPVDARFSIEAACILPYKS